MNKKPVCIMIECNDSKGTVFHCHNDIDGIGTGGEGNNSVLIITESGCDTFYRLSEIICYKIENYPESERDDLRASLSDGCYSYRNIKDIG